MEFSRRGVGWAKHGWKWLRSSFEANHLWPLFQLKSHGVLGIPRFAVGFLRNIPRYYHVFSSILDQFETWKEPVISPKLPRYPHHEVRERTVFFYSIPTSNPSAPWKTSPTLLAIRTPDSWHGLIPSLQSGANRVNPFSRGFSVCYLAWPRDGGHGLESLILNSAVICHLDEIMLVEVYLGRDILEELFGRWKLDKVLRLMLRYFCWYRSLGITCFSPVQLISLIPCFKSLTNILH